MNALRITGGTLRGRKVPVPPREVRPTSERARQAFFNIVSERLFGTRFLDLFAGSGIFSFEAVSRGASSAVAVDLSRTNAAAITHLAAQWDVNVTASAGDAISALGHLRGETFGLVYADPPYDFARHGDLLDAIAAGGCLQGDALVAIEHRKRTEPFGAAPAPLVPLRRAEYGEVWITMWTARTCSKSDEAASLA